MIFTNPVFMGFLGVQAPPDAPAPAPRTIDVTPLDPGTLGPAPATQTFTVNATGLTEVKWAVFNQDWSSTGSWTTLPIPTGGTATFTATFTANGQRVKVLSVDEVVQVVTGQVTLGTTGPAKPATAPTTALAIQPAQPGTLTPNNGIATWATWIGSNVYTTLLYVEVNGADAAQPYSFKGNWKTATLVNGWAQISANFDATGQFLKIANPGNQGEQMDSGTVTLSAGTATPPPSGRAAPTQALQFDPVEPGTIQPVNGVARWSPFIGSNTLLSLVWQVFDGPPNYAARGAWQTVPLSGGWAQVNADFTQSGQFVKIADPNNTGQAIGSGAVTVPVPTPSPPPAPNPTPTPTPTSTPVARLDIYMRGQSNLYFAHDQAGADYKFRDIVAYLTQIPTVNLISRISEVDGTIFSGTYSFFTNTTQGRWLEGVGGVDPSQWQGHIDAQLMAIQTYASSDPNHAFLDWRLHWEYDMGVWEEPWKSLYRVGTWELTQRFRRKAAKNPGRYLTAYATCSYDGGSRASLGVMDESWLADWADGTLYVVNACGNMVDGEVRTQWGEDWSHNSDNALNRSFVRSAIQMSRKLWEIGWCPSGVDLSWLPKLGPYISGGSRSGSSAFLTVTRDPTSQGGGTNLVAGAAGIRWNRFACVQIGAATGGAIIDANTIRVDFGSTLPAGAQIHHCNDPSMTLGDGRNIIRDNWHDIRPAASANIPNISWYESLLQRTLKPIVLP